MKEKIAIYPGSFNPFTKGHAHILNKALDLFDRVYVVYSKNSEKSSNIDYVEQLDQRHRLEEIPGVLTYTANDVLTVDVCKTLGAKYIIRGIRNAKDFEYEKNIASINKILMPSVETIFITSDKNYEDISSSMVRELRKYNKDVSQFVF